MSELQDCYRDFLQRGGFAEMSQRFGLVIRGADRVRYLNGQITSSVPRPETGATQAACVTTAKGKLCAEIDVAALPDALIVDADCSLRETLPARLERYIVADDVTVEPVADGLRLVHFLGHRPELVGIAPERVHRSKRMGREGWDVWIEAAALESLRPSLLRAYAELPEALLESLRIENGVPRWGFELDENTLPPEAGLDRTHVDYHKGCYIGQEVISRLKSVGHVNRTLVGLVSGGAALCPGQEIFSPASPETSAGRITSAAWSFALEKPVALGYLKRSVSREGLFARGPKDSPDSLPETPLDVQELPLIP
jgi:folate-binding protein YgfZ